MNSRWLFLFILLASWASAHHSAEPVTETCKTVSVHCGRTPSATWFDSTLWVAFVQGKHVYVTHSTDEGESYSPPVRVNDKPEIVETNGENRPKIAVTPKAVLVSWTQKTPGQYTGDIRFARSLDGGKTFTEPMTINDDGLLIGHRFDSLTVTPDGTVYIAWLDKRNKHKAKNANKPYPGSAVYYAVSTNHGKTFSKNFPVANHSCECCRIATAAAPDNKLALFWRHLFGDKHHIRDHAFAVASATGEILSLGRATFDNWHIDACPHHGPAMAPATTGGYHLAWFTNGKRQQGLLYGFYNPAKKATTHVRVMDSRAGASHPQVAAFKGVVYFAWKLFDGEQTRIQVATSLNAGKSWSKPRTLATTKGASDHPLLITSDKTVYLTWHTQNEGFRVIPVDLNTDFNTDSLQHFVAGSMAQIEERYKQRPFMVSLWSLTCPPCLHELELLSQWRKANPHLPLVLISTDGLDNSAKVTAKLVELGLQDADNWIYADAYTAKLRFAIDPNWRGELPRSYFYGPQTKRHAVSGTLTPEMLQKWQTHLKSAYDHE